MKPLQQIRLVKDMLFIRHLPKNFNHLKYTSRLPETIMISRRLD